MNLLPESARKRVASEYRAKAIFVGSLILLFVAATAFLALLPAVLVSSGERAAEELGAFEPRSDQAREDREKALETQSLLATLTPLLVSTTSVTQIVQGVLTLRPEGVSVHSVSYVNEDGARLLVVSGVSQNREKLNTYRTSLAGSGAFRRVSVPVNALVGAGSGIFSITLGGF